ncbi:uncharacterized protein LOC6602425 isoform X2 [Drosophila persimilis]|uniref:uncharacterized protein LOC6602425 isoform X2 n=1 Tax=Drosophila persimilis TaxID=7234 RepID=UPI000F088DF2|nr:uncharacterized protein LOC6602425 isoform X2 [Drosophila persimilis]
MARMHSRLAMRLNAAWPGLPGCSCKCVANKWQTTANIEQIFLCSLDLDGSCSSSTFSGNKGPRQSRDRQRAIRRAEGPSQEEEHDMRQEKIASTRKKSSRLIYYRICSAD